MSDQLLEELNLGSARGGKRQAKPLLVSVVRSLSEADLALLQAPPPVAAPGQRLARISYSHHQLAQLLAKGEDDTSASLITGYSLSYIWQLRHDPAFCELLSTYSAERLQIFVDVLERMKALGLSSLDEIKARLAEAPEAWSRRELMELAELMLVKGQQGGGKSASSSTAPSVTINVSPKFVQAEAKAAAEVEVISDLDWQDLS